MRVTLVSFAEGEPYASVRSMLNASAAAAGFDAVLLWDMATFLEAPLARRLANELAALQAHAKRPYCDAFKMIAILHAMERGEEGDYVLGADASRHFPYPLRAGSVKKAIERLNSRAPAELRPVSVYGRTQCVGLGLGEAVAEVLANRRHPASAFAPYFARQLPVLGGVIACQLLLANTRRNRLLVREWLGMAVDSPAAFCGHGSEDNFALIALGCKHSLPSVITHPTRQLESGFPSRFTWSALSTQFLLASLESGAFTLVPNACGGPLVRDACKAWLANPASRRSRLADEPKAFFPRGTCVNETRWSLNIRASLEGGTELDTGFVRPCGKA